MRKAMSRILLSGILAAAVLGATACSSKKEEATAAGTTAGGSQETVASADGIGFPKDETITLVVPGKARSAGRSYLGTGYGSQLHCSRKSRCSYLLRIRTRSTHDRSPVGHIYLERIQRFFPHGKYSSGLHVRSVYIRFRSNYHLRSQLTGSSLLLNKRFLFLLLTE